MLAKGLSFAPTHNLDLYRTLLDVNRLAQNLTLRNHFTEKQVCLQEIRLTPYEEEAPIGNQEISDRTYPAIIESSIWDDAHNNKNI